MEEMREIQKQSKASSPNNDDVWELSRQGSLVPPQAEPVFYYSRKHRLEHSSRSIQKLHDPDADANQGRGFHLFSRLARHPSQKVPFISLMVLFLFIAFVSIFTERMGTKQLGGNTIKAEAKRFNGTTLVSINKTFEEKNIGNVYTGPVDVATAPFPRPRPSIRRNPFAEKDVVVDEDHPVVAARLEFTLEQEEVYEISLPYEAPDLVLLMQNDEELITLRLSVKRPFSLWGLEF